jgi:hypothetical protein
MTDTPEQNIDLVALLSADQCRQLTILISTAITRMRTALEELPYSNNGPPNVADSNASRQTYAVLGAEKKPPPSVHPSSELLDLQKAALKSFDAWRDAVLSRITEVLDSRGSNSRFSPPPSRPLPSDPIGLSFLQTHYPPIPTPLTSLPVHYHPLILQSILLLLLSLTHYDSRSRALLLHLTSSLNLSPIVLTTSETTTARSLLTAASLASPDARAPQTNRWKVALASVAGATILGLTGGLAAPLIAAGIGSVLGGIGLGATAAATYLGALASNTALIGVLFGAYGGKTTGDIMSRYAAEVEDFSFLPVSSPSPAPENPEDARLRVAIGVTGWIVSSPTEITTPWRVLGEGVQAFALRWEVQALTDLGEALRGTVRSCAVGFVRGEIIRQTVFATLYSALWPVALVKAGRLVDNPYSIASRRAEKAGIILADALVEKAQGERPVTLVGFSLGARVVYFCLLELARRDQWGLVENVVLMGAPVPADEELWRKMKMVVVGRLVNVYSGQDYVLAFLYRTASIQLGVAGLQEVQVKGVENVDVGDIVEGHLSYRFAVGKILKDVLRGDMDMEAVGVEEERLSGELKKEKDQVSEAEMKEEDVEKAIETEEQKLSERRRIREEEGRQQHEKSCV